jgi:hypothetical protein
MSVVDVLQENRVEGWVSESSYRLWYASAVCLDRDIVVLFEVNSGVLLRGIIRLAIELLLHAHVASTRNVLSVLPHTVTKGFSLTTISAPLVPSSGPSVSCLLAIPSATARERRIIVAPIVSASSSATEAAA